MKRLIFFFIISVGFLIIHQSSFAASPVFIFPKGGENLERWKNYVIQWTGGVDSIPKLELVGEKGDVIGVMLGSSNGPGTQTWSPTPRICIDNVDLHTCSDYPAGKYKIRITDSSGMAESNLFNIIDIAAPSAVILSPNGGETFEKGSKIPIRWKIGNGTLPENAPAKIYISWSNGCRSEIASIKATDLSYKWQIPDNVVPGSEFKIFVEHPAGGYPYPSVPKDYFLYGESKSFFTITGNVPQSPSLALISPSGNESWGKGETHRIEWRSVGIPEDLGLDIVLMIDPSKGELAQQKIIATVKAIKEFYDWTLAEDLSSATYAIELVADVRTNFIGGKCYEIGGAIKPTIAIKSKQVLVTPRTNIQAKETVLTPLPETKTPDRTFLNFFYKIFVAPIKWLFGLFAR